MASQRVFSEIRLVNGSAGDPMLYVDYPGRDDALLFDAGENAALPIDRLADLAAVFITHHHVDHFIGLDRIVRANIDADKTVSIFGPEGTIRKVYDRIKSYEYQYFRRITGNPSHPLCKMDEFGYERPDVGGENPIFDYMDYANHKDDYGVLDTRWVGCGQFVDTSEGESYNQVWTPPPVMVGEKPDGTNWTRNEPGAQMLPYYLFSVGANGVTGAYKEGGTIVSYGDDIVSWDPERNLRRSYR